VVCGKSENQPFAAGKNQSALRTESGCATVEPLSLGCSAPARTKPRGSLLVRSPFHRCRLRFSFAKSHRTVTLKLPVRVIPVEVTSRRIGMLDSGVTGEKD